jgi:dTDP-4-amino-4,6-dideoxygalactose transaminase
MVALMDIAKRHQLAVIEDACLALGAAIGSTKVGHWGDVTCFSFAPSKHLGSYGSGGMAVTKDAALAAKMQAYVAYGQAREKHYHKGLAGRGLAHQVEGLNERLDELQAALLRVKLPYLESWLAQRRQLAQRYHQAFEGCAVALPVEQPGYRHAYRNYVIHTPQRAQLQEHLARQGIATSLLYSPPLHLQPAYAARGFKPGSFPVTEAASERQLSLPMRPNLTLAQQDYVIDKVLEVAATQTA